jgi:hypothetical protein
MVLPESILEKQNKAGATKTQVNRPAINTRVDYTLPYFYGFFMRLKEFDPDLRESAQSEAEAHHGWHAELVDEIKLTNSRSKETANFVVRPADLIRQGLAGKFSIDSMDIQDLQTGATRSIVSDSPAPWVYILDAVDALFYDTPALQARLQTQLKAYQDKGLPMLPGLKKREHFGQGMPVGQFIKAQDQLKKITGNK